MSDWKTISSVSAPSYKLALRKSAACANGHLYMVVLASAKDGVSRPSDLLEEKIFCTSEAARNYFDDTLFNLRRN